MYFPEKIRWRIEQLRKVLADDVPELEQIIQEEKPLFPEYTGKRPTGPVAECVPAGDSIWSKPSGDMLPSLRWQSLLYGPDKADVRWAASYDAEALYIIVADAASSNLFSSTSISSVTLKVEPRRLWPAKHFLFDTGADRPGMEKRVLKGTGTWVLRIPLELIGIPWKASLPFGRLPRAVLFDKSRGDIAAEYSQREREWPTAKNRCQSRRHAHRLPHQQTERRCLQRQPFFFFAALATAGLYSGRACSSFR